MFWKLGPSGLNQLEFSKLVQQLHYAAPVSSSSLFHIDTFHPPRPPYGPFSFSLLISSFTLLARAVMSLNQKAPRRTCVCELVSQQTKTQKKVIKWVDQRQNPKILQSDLATMAINYLLCSTLSLFIVILHPSRLFPTSPTPTPPSPLRLPFRYLAPGETVGQPCCCICL